MHINIYVFIYIYVCKYIDQLIHILTYTGEDSLGESIFKKMKEKGVEVELRKERIAKNYLSGNTDLLGNPDLEQGMGVMCVICIFFICIFVCIYMHLYVCIFICGYKYV
jgi:hypothetical protein